MTNTSAPLANDNKPEPKSILVVDDEPLLRDAISRQLKKEGYNVLIAENGHQAYDQLSQKQVQLVVSDIRMPNGDGIELLSKIKKNHHSINVILMTGYTDTPPEKAYHLGADGILRKPFNFDDFIEKIKQSLSGPSKHWAKAKIEEESANIVFNFPQNFKEVLNAKHIMFGRGGFAIHIKDIFIAMEKDISFYFNFGQDKPEVLSGRGTLKWNHSQSSQPKKQFIGIEIQALSEDCFDTIVDHIDAEVPISYIPSY